MALPISCAAPVPMHGRVRPNELSARVPPRLTLCDQDPSGSFFELGPPVVPRFAMNPVDPQGPTRSRWKWFVIAAAAIVSARVPSLGWNPEASRVMAGLTRFPVVSRM